MTFDSTAIADSVSNFLNQPFGVVGAAGVMAAVTTINSERISRWLQRIGLPIKAVFNALYLVGGTALLCNAVLRSEPVWVVLQVYMIGITLRGLTSATLSARLRLPSLPRPALRLRRRRAASVLRR